MLLERVRVVPRNETKETSTYVILFRDRPFFIVVTVGVVRFSRSIHQWKSRLAHESTTRKTLLWYYMTSEFISSTGRSGAIASFHGGLAGGAPPPMVEDSALLFFFFLPSFLPSRREKRRRQQISPPSLLICVR